MNSIRYLVQYFHPTKLEWRLNVAVLLDTPELALKAMGLVQKKFPDTKLRIIQSVKQDGLITQSVYLDLN